jgi:pimeloyl-ACP methyl ester carboxylesterase
VKHGSYGAIGHSLGGHNAIFTAVFDPRITVVVSSCGFDSFLDYYSGDPKMWEPGKGWTQRRYMPRLADYAGRLNEIPFDFHELIALLAPRVVFVSAPLGDTNFQWRSVDRIIAAAKPLYQKHGAENNLQVVHPDCGHDFPDAIREQAYQLFEKQLR